MWISRPCSPARRISARDWETRAPGSGSVHSSRRNRHGNMSSGRLANLSKHGRGAASVLWYTMVGQRARSERGRNETCMKSKQTNLCLSSGGYIAALLYTHSVGQGVGAVRLAIACISRRCQRRACAVDGPVSVDEAVNRRRLIFLTGRPAGSNWNAFVSSGPPPHLQPVFETRGKTYMDRNILLPQRR